MPKKPTQVIETTLDALTPDDANANRGTQRGTGLMENSLRDLGAGRSILLDRNGKIIAGNKTTEGAASVGMENVLIVQTDGTQLVAVQRMDLDLDEVGGKARDLAFRDNRIAEVNLDWDLDVLLEQQKDGLNLNSCFNDLELQEMYAENANSTTFLNEFLADSPGSEQNTNTSADAPSGAVTGQDAAPELAPGETSGASSAQTDAQEKPQEFMKFFFLLPPKSRDQAAEKLKAIMDAHKYPTMAHALCHLLEIEYAA